MEDHSSFVAIFDRFRSGIVVGILLLLCFSIAIEGNLEKPQVNYFIE